MNDGWQSGVSCIDIIPIQLCTSSPNEPVRGRYHAGIRSPDWYKPNPKAYTLAPHELLLKLKADLTGSDLVIMASIIEQFAE